MAEKAVDPLQLQCRCWHTGYPPTATRYTHSNRKFRHTNLAALAVFLELPY